MINENNNRSEFRRKIHYFHITHANFELDPTIKSNGWTAGHDLAVVKLWNDIEKILESLQTPHKMYNDSYVRTVPTDIDVQIFAPIDVPEGIISVIGNNRAGHNDTALFKLGKRGSALVMCEDAELHRLCFLSNLYRDKLRYMFQRNAFIACQINRSLLDGEHGVLFLGSLHNLENDMVNLLDNNGIEVIQHNASGFTSKTVDDIRLMYPDKW